MPPIVSPEHHADRANASLSSSGAIRVARHSRISSAWVKYPREFAPGPSVRTH